jgi:hypothetical protein
VSDRARTEALRVKYLRKFEQLTDEIAQLETDIARLELDKDEAKRSEDQLVESANTRMKAGGGVAAGGAAAAVTLLTKFGVLVCPVLAIPVAAAIWAGNALSSRSNIRKSFGTIASDLDARLLDRKTRLGVVRRDLEDKRTRFQRVEELWRKTL